MTDIMGIFGLQGWGKSALTAYFALLAHNMGYTIYSNFPLSFDYIPITTIKEAQNCRNGYLCLDEIWAWVHARTSQSKINKEMMAICLLNRKRNVNIIYNTQLPRTIDVILREVTNYRYLPHLVTHKDGKRYIHYTVKDLLDRETEEMVVPMSIDEIGKLFNTRYEVKKLGEEVTPIEKGIGLEKDFANAIKKVKGVKYVDVLPNSGNGSSWGCDVIVYANNGVYGFDVKGACRTHVNIDEYGKNIIKKIKNIKQHKAFPYIAFPDNKYIRLISPNAWFIHKLTENSYLKGLNTKARKEKLIKQSKRLSELQFV